MSAGHRRGRSAAAVDEPGQAWEPVRAASTARPAARIASSGAGRRRSSARPGAPPGARAGPGRRPAPGPRPRRPGPAASATGRRPRRRPPRPGRPAPPPRRSGRPRGGWRPGRPRRRRPARSGVRRPPGRPGCRAAAATVSAARAASRTSRVTSRQPRSASPSSTDAAVAPPPRTTARCTGPSCRSRRAAATPGTSVLCPRRRPSREHHGVRAAGLPGPVADLVEQRHHGPLERHRQRQPAPRLVQAGEERRQRRLRDVDGVVGPVEPELGVRRPVQRRRQRVRDRAAQHRAPGAGHRVRPLSRCRTGRTTGRTPACSSGGRRSWSANFVSPVSGLVVTKYSHVPSAGLSAPPRSPCPRAPSIGVGGSPGHLVGVVRRARAAGPSSWCPTEPSLPTA